MNADGEGKNSRLTRRRGGTEGHENRGSKRSNYETDPFIPFIVNYGTDFIVVRFTNFPIVRPKDFRTSAANPHLSNRAIYPHRMKNQKRLPL